MFDLPHAQFIAGAITLTLSNVNSEVENNSSPTAAVSNDKNGEGTCTLTLYLVITCGTIRNGTLHLVIPFFSAY